MLQFSNMKGHWISIFTEKEDGIEIVFTEEVTAKKPEKRGEVSGM